MPSRFYPLSIPVVGILAGIVLLLSMATMCKANVKEECKSLTSGPGYDYCMTFLLGSYPQAQDTDNTTTLAAICAQISMTMAQMEKGHYLQLAQNETNALVKRALEECAGQYNDAQDSCDQSRRAIQVSDYRAAYARIRAAMSYVDECKDGLKKSGGENQDTDYINEPYDRALSLTFAFITKLHVKGDKKSH